LNSRLELANIADRRCAVSFSYQLRDATDPLAEEPLHLDEVGGHPRTDLAAPGVHEVDKDELAGNQIIIE